MPRSALQVAALLLLSSSAWGCGLAPPELPAEPVRDHSFRGVTVVEPGGLRVANADLVVSGGVIQSVTPHEDATASAEGTATKNADDAYAGYFALPGLIDLHVHHPPPFALGTSELFGLLFLAHGVTSVRDTGSLWGSALELAAESREPSRATPRIFACGPLLTGFVPAPTGMRAVTGKADAIAAVRELKERGADCIKLHNGLSRESVLALIAEAGRLGIPAVAHVPEGSSLQAMAGSEVQHLMKITPSWSRVRHDAIERYVRTSSTLGITHTPTLVVFDQVVKRQARPITDPDAARWLPRYMREVLWSEERNPAVQMLREASGSDPNQRMKVMRETVAALHAAGVPLQLGTDTPNPGVVPGASVYEELRLLNEAGMSLEEAWIAGTRAAGAALRVPKLGTLAAGAPADLLLFREDPTRDLAALSTLEAIVVGGRLYRREALLAALEAQRRYFESAWYDRTSMLLSRWMLGWLVPDPR